MANFQFQNFVTTSRPMCPTTCIDPRIFVQPPKVVQGPEHEFPHSIRMTNNGGTTLNQMIIRKVGSTWSIGGGGVGKPSVRDRGTRVVRLPSRRIHISAPMIVDVCAR